VSDGFNHRNPGGARVFPEKWQDYRPKQALDGISASMRPEMACGKGPDMHSGLSVNPVTRYDLLLNHRGDKYMKLFISTLTALCMLCLVNTAAFAQAQIAESLLIHLDLDLDKSALSPTNVQVKIHATDHYADYYFASPADPGEGDEIDWNQDLQIMVSDNVPMRLIFHISDTNGAALPAGYTVDWDMSGDSGEESGNSFIIPAGTSGDMSLSVQGSVTSQ